VSRAVIFGHSNHSTDVSHTQLRRANDAAAIAVQLLALDWEETGGRCRIRGGGLLEGLEVLVWCRKERRQADRN